MGTYYSLGVVQAFEAQTIASLTSEQLANTVNERLNLDLFDWNFTDGCLQGTLKDGLFSENIADLFQKLAAIANRSRDTVEYYLQEFGDNIEEYPQEFCRLIFFDDEGNKIKLEADLVLLFIEGKVLAEMFSIEPALINWLFRHSSFDNPLTGAIMSSIVG
ncbi:MAG: hypothetical protein F6K41_24515 [Symploca sp. SIO3E6]|nr:hypothetical protein [Caldora sp. SIO3E6]